MQRRYGWAVGLLAALVAWAAVRAGLLPGRSGPENAPPPAPAPRDGGTLWLGLFASPRGRFNPLLAEDSHDGMVVGLVFDSLVAPGPDGNWEPRLAEEVKVSPDGRSIYLRLRRDVTWHDGHPFTARDVAFTLRLLVDRRYTGLRSEPFLSLAGARDYRAGRVREVRGIRLLGSHELLLTLERPYAPFLAALSLPILPAHRFAGTPPDRLAAHPDSRQPVGTGPFRFVRYRPDQYVELARYDAYWQGRPHIERVVLRVVNPDLALGQMLTGELDWITARPGDLALLPSGAPFTVVEKPASGYQFVGVNHRHPFLADRRVRQALMHAIDRQGIVERLLDGHGTVVNGPIPPASWAYDPTGLNPYPYDPNRAAALLAAAGFRRGPGGWLYRDGRPFAVTLRYPSGDPVRERVAPLIQANLARVGVRVDLERMEFSTLAEAVFDRQEFDLFLLAWSLGDDPDPGPIFQPGSRWGGVTGWQHPRSRELLSAGVAELDPAARQAIYAEWNRLLNRELPYLFLYAPHGVEVVSGRVRGLRPDRRGALWNLHQLWLADGD